MTEEQRKAVETALAALGLPVDAAERLAVSQGGERLPSRLAVDEVAVACVGAALLAAAALHESRGGAAVRVGLDAAGVRAAVVSERFFRLGDREPSGGFAPLSRFWAAADGWLRTHANFPWHHAALLRAVGAKEDGELEDAISSFGAAEAEDRIFAAGGVAAAVRSAEEWGRHPQGSTVAAEPLVAVESFDGAAARRREALVSVAGTPMPAAGVRVLDLTRVIAGPVGSRFLGALGADVLRIDPPGLPDMPPGAPFDTLLGKRSAFLDLGESGGRERLEALLGEADVLLIGYRPGAMERFGLAPADLAARHPGLAIVQLAAWGHSGPWAERRGFDSIVQAAAGIAATEAAEDGAPGALPCQLLDHGTGYLVAAAALDALRRQEAGGGTEVRRVSLARTAHWLFEASEAGSVPPSGDDAGAAVGAGAAEVPLVDLACDGEIVTAVAPPGALDGAALRWPQPVGRYGEAEPAFITAM